MPLFPCRRILPWRFPAGKRYVAPPRQRPYARLCVNIRVGDFLSPPGDVIMLQRLVVMPYVAIPAMLPPLCACRRSRRPALTDGRPARRRLPSAFGLYIVCASVGRQEVVFPIKFYWLHEYTVGMHVAAIQGSMPVSVNIHSCPDGVLFTVVMWCAPIEAIWVVSISPSRPCRMALWR